MAVAMKAKAAGARASGKEAAGLKRGAPKGRAAGAKSQAHKTDGPVLLRRKRKTSKKATKTMKAVNQDGGHLASGVDMFDDLDLQFQEKDVQGARPLKIHKKDGDASAASTARRKMGKFVRVECEACDAVGLSDVNAATPADKKDSQVVAVLD